MKLEDGQPCGHPGCLNHVTHPCEGCGRIAGRRNRLSTGREGVMDWAIFISGAIVGWFSLYGIAHIPGGKIDRYNTAIESCEKDLPRSQKCHIVAAPDTKG